MDDKKSNVEKDSVKKSGEKDSFNVSKKNLGVFVALAVVVVLGFVIYQSFNSDVAAVVNGDKITVSELDKAYETLPPQYQAVTTKADLLKQLVQTKVFYQEAVEEGYSETEEAMQQVELLKANSGLTEEEFSSSLALQGFTEEELLDQYEKQLIVQKYLDENLISKMEVSEEEIESYYSEHPEEFETVDSVVVRHILIGDADLTPKERKDKAAILIASTTKENFCERVKEYTTDVASAETCGEYAFTRDDPLVQEFKDLSFKQGNGQIGLVDTEFGTHIIWTVEKFPARTVGFEEAKPQIEQRIRNEKASAELDGFYEEVSKDDRVKIKFDEL
ncbi:MAG: peptidylprolyl isomerase [Nanoarchaeota archaeon]|nr:peptidylprolyl isomerase [Nanoarchaeota archaeon]